MRMRAGDLLNSRAGYRPESRVDIIYRVVSIFSNNIPGVLRMEKNIDKNKKKMHLNLLICWGEK